MSRLTPFTNTVLSQLIDKYSPREILINEEQEKILRTCFTCEEWYRMCIKKDLESSQIEWQGVTIVLPPRRKRQGTLDLRNGEPIFKDDSE